MLWTWQHCDISANSVYKSNFTKALQGITSTSVIMPGRTDLYMPPEDAQLEVEGIGKNAELRVIDSIWGHWAGITSLFSSGP